MLPWRAQALPVVFLRQDVFAPAPHSAAAATASAVALEIKLRTAARVGSDAACTDARAFGTHSAHVELAAPCTNTSHDITTPGSRSRPHPLYAPPPPPMPPPARREMGSCLQLAPPPGDRLPTARKARAFWSSHSSGGGGNGRRTGWAHRSNGGGHSPSS